MEWYLRPFKKYADFSGRARRKNSDYGDNKYGPNPKGEGSYIPGGMPE